MYETVKFSNVSKDIIDDFIALPPVHYNRLKQIIISHDIKEYVYTESHFPIIYNNMEKQSELHGAERPTSYYTMLIDQILNKLYREGNSSSNDDYAKDRTFGSPRESDRKHISDSFNYDSKTKNKSSALNVVIYLSLYTIFDFRNNS